MHTYQPCDVFELYVQAEDLIGVIKRKDPSGQEHRWYVDRGEVKGFLPKAILAPYQKPISSTSYKGMLQTQQSIESCSSLVSSHSSDRSTPTLQPLQPIPAYEPVDLLPECHRYDTVPEEDPHTSLLSFNEIDTSANTDIKNALSEFDPLASNISSQNPSNNSSSTEKLHSSLPSNSSSGGPPEVLENLYMAAYPFKAADPNQLTLDFGQKVFVKQRSDVQGNSEWWFVVNSFGKEGYVPANYLRKC